MHVYMDIMCQLIKLIQKKGNKNRFPATNSSNE